VTGTGAPYALGALQALISGKELTLKQAKRTALKAIAIASKFDPYTGAPFHANYQETDK
jgi:ATP-dependent protease HslVU (ClpYQ) peptidase subunit